MNLLDQNIIKEFLFDSYSIDDATKIRGKFKRCSTEEEKKRTLPLCCVKKSFFAKKMP